MNKSTGNLENILDPASRGDDTSNEPAVSKGQLTSLAKLNLTPEIVHTLPAEFVKRHGILPLEINNGTIRIATSAPGNLRVIDDIRLLSGLEVEEIQAPAEEIAAKIAECYQVTVERMVENFDPAKTNGEVKNLHDIEVMANEPTVVNLVNLIIATALRERLVQCLTKSGCALLVFETDDGRTFAGADASILRFVVFIAFF